MAKTQPQGRGGNLVISLGDDCGGTCAALARIRVVAVDVCFINHRRGMSIASHSFPGSLQSDAPAKASEASLKGMLHSAAPVNILVVASCHPCLRTVGGMKTRVLREAARRIRLGRSLCATCGVSFAWVIQQSVDDGLSPSQVFYETTRPVGTSIVSPLAWDSAECTTIVCGVRLSSSEALSDSGSQKKGLQQSRCPSIADASRAPPLHSGASPSRGNSSVSQPRSFTCAAAVQRR